MDEPREISIEELRTMVPAARARYLGELARASLEQNMQRFTSDAEPTPAKG